MLNNTSGRHFHKCRYTFPSLLPLLVLLPLLSVSAAAGPNLVRNGAFEDGADAQGRPVGWEVSGLEGSIEQTVTLIPGRDDGHAAMLTCTKFTPGAPSSHAMLAQFNAVGARQGTTYRLTFWVRGKDMKTPAAQVALRNTKTWEDSGLTGTFPVQSEWQRVEKVFTAKSDVPSASSRLQFWFGSTGTLCIDDVLLEPNEEKVEFHPALTTDVANPIPNSSFECGTAGWGSYSPTIRMWGNMFRLHGEIDDTTAVHGRRSLRIPIAKGKAPSYAFDYYDAVSAEAYTVVAGHIGWMPVKQGDPYVISCYMKADRDGVPALLLAQDSHKRIQRQSVTVGKEWKRYQYVCRPTGDYMWVGAGPDLTDSDEKEATLWLDAVQVESGRQASDYMTRETVETFLVADEQGYVFTDPDAGASVRLVACNNHADKDFDVRGRLTVKDFRDTVIAEQAVSLKVERQSVAERRLTELAKGRLGFFRVEWSPEGVDTPYALAARTAVIRKYPHNDSAFGMNHAYPWDFMLDLSRMAGLTWMRDWSVKWDAVQPQPGPFDFSGVDPIVDRVMDRDLRLLMLFPFPSASWASEADEATVREHGGDSRYMQRRMKVAALPKKREEYRAYLEQSVDHYRERVQFYEVMNEPLYTTYSVPQKFGYEMKDYVDLLHHSYETIKRRQPGSVVLGGMGTWAGSHWVHEFIEADGLRWCDVMDIHLYPFTVTPTVYADELRDCVNRMKARGQMRPIWLTEFGCYADDDPHQVPSTIGDTAMAKSNWATEHEAAQGLVKTAAVFLSHGVEKIFFHSGSSGTLNGSSGSGIFFEYGGAPRKMYPALAAVSVLLGPKWEPLPAASSSGKLRVYAFRTPRGVVAIAWSEDASPVKLARPGGVRAYDLMGNAIPAGTLSVGTEPIYLVAADEASLKNVTRP